MPHVERTSRTSFERDHEKDHAREVARKADRDGSGRMERHSGEWMSFANERKVFRHRGVTFPLFLLTHRPPPRHAPLVAAAPPTRDGRVLYCHRRTGSVFAGVGEL
jgi:hypothetical protein